MQTHCKRKQAFMWLDFRLYIILHMLSYIPSLHQTNQQEENTNARIFMKEPINHCKYLLKQKCALLNSSLFGYITITREHVDGYGSRVTVTSNCIQSAQLLWVCAALREVALPNHMSERSADSEISIKLLHTTSLRHKHVHFTQTTPNNTTRSPFIDTQCFSRCFLFPQVI